MSARNTGNGTWLVVGILLLGVVLALVGLKFRRFPERDGAPPTTPATTQADVR